MRFYVQGIVKGEERIPHSWRNNEKEVENLKVQFNNIPEGIRVKPLYCLAKLEQKPGKNKPDKIPYQITGARASPNNQCTYILRYQNH